MKMSSTQIALLLCLVALLGPVTDCTFAKRFDCELFCRTTGFHGNVGGCRCSFTLFTSKRQDNSLNGGLLQDLTSSMSSPDSSRRSQYSNDVPSDELDHYIRI